MGRHNTYEYDGRTFTSVKDLADYVGIYDKTLEARLKRGLPLEEACRKTDFRCNYREEKAYQNKSLSQICREQHKDEDLVRNRLKRGYSLNEALNKPKKISRQGKPIIVNGILYNSIQEALRALNLTDKEGIVRCRLHRGMPPDQAFYFED